MLHYTINFGFQIYTGPYRNSERRAQDVQEATDISKLEQGHFVAVVLPNYKKRQVIGKVLELTGDSQFVIGY